jgi:type IV pilus assembly protein PilV
MKRHVLNASLRSRRGFTLVEILVAVVVLSLGLLGLAALQATGFKSNHSSYVRTQAINLAYDVVDRMRANRPNAMTNNYDIAIGAAAPAAPATQAGIDLKEWKGDLSALLPSGDGGIVVDATDGLVTVTVRWDDGIVNGGVQSLRVVTRL